jgi:hypothetical protein
MIVYAVGPKREIFSIVPPRDEALFKKPKPNTSCWAIFIESLRDNSTPALFFTHHCTESHPPGELAGVRRYVPDLAFRRYKPPVRPTLPLDQTCDHE